MLTTTTPLGAFYPPINPLAIAVALDAGFVARGFCGDTQHLTGLIKQAIEYPGFALVDILQNCVSYNKVNTFGWYQKRVYKLQDDPKYDTGNRTAAFAKACEWPGNESPDVEERIPIGVIYRSSRPAARLPGEKEVPLVDVPLDYRKRAKLIEEFR
jgi:2-oxoglutarate ferredoxin oxidoreductase subunit beta